MERTGSLWWTPNLLLAQEWFEYSAPGLFKKKSPVRYAYNEIIEAIVEPIGCISDPPSITFLLKDETAIQLETFNWNFWSCIELLRPRLSFDIDDFNVY